MATANVITEDKLGSNCSGIEGATNRVLTLSNTLTTVDNGLLVFVTGMQQIQDTDFTITHNSTASTITFLRNIFNDMPLTVQYFESASSSPVVITGISSKIAMFMSIINTHGQTATLRKTIPNRDAMGGIISYTETDYSIRWLQQPITEKDRSLVEMGLAIAGNIKAFFYPYYTSAVTGVPGPDITINTGDLVIDTSGNQWRIETKLGGRIADGQEIFSPAILKKLNIDSV